MLHLDLYRAGGHAMIRYKKQIGWLLAVATVWPRFLADRAICHEQLAAGELCCARGSIFRHDQRIVSTGPHYWAKSCETIMRVNRFAIELKRKERALCVFGFAFRQ